MREYFKGIGKIEYEGRTSKNPLSFRHYNAEELVGGKTMREWLKFSVAYWHTFCGEGTDPFGNGTFQRPWLQASDPLERARDKMRAAFEFFKKLGVDYYCFHDRDIAPEGATLRETNRNLDEMAVLAKQLQKETGVRLLWGTANCFSHPRYMHGAGTSCEAKVFAYAAAQIKKALEVTKELGGENYVFWGGREGYETLLNTCMKTELENFANLLRMAVDYAGEIGFAGQFLIEPKPKEPTKHQYDCDIATVLGFLRQYGLEKYFKMNIETNHATLAGHTMQHELHLARINGVLGSVDANMGDTLLGWDTDQFPTDLYVTTLAMYEIIQNGGLGKGGLNFDAKPRRGSFTPEDMFIAHIAGMDAFARGLKAAHRMYEEKALINPLKERYSSWFEGIGAEIRTGRLGLKELETYALDNCDDIPLESGRQEWLESVVNEYL